MKVVQETLGLSSITIAADTYTTVLPELARQSAEDVAALIRHTTLTGRSSKPASRYPGARARTWPRCYPPGTWPACGERLDHSGERTVIKTLVTITLHSPGQAARRALGAQVPVQGQLAERSGLAPGCWDRRRRLAVRAA